MATNENDEATSSSAESEPSSIALLPTASDVLACQFSAWYPVFSNLSTKYKGRSNVTIKSVIIENVPDEFRDYLNSDRLILPADTRTSSALLEAHAGQNPEWSSDDDDDENDDVSEEPRFSFPELNQQIDDAITLLGGAAMPKLNWSAPKDAVWVNAGTLECRFAGDVYMLLKASDFCSYDVHHALQDVVAVPPPPPPPPLEDVPRIDAAMPQLQLVLRKWCNLYPSQEFRCFVRCKQLIAISQRHHSQHWPHLEEHRDQILYCINDFFQHVLQEQRTVQLQNYAFDVYIDKRQRVWLLDLNVWASRTDSLLFAWSELQHIDELQLRLVETERQVRADPLASYKAPIDTLHVASSGDHKFREFMGMCERPSAIASDDDEEDWSDNARKRK